MPSYKAIYNPKAVRDHEQILVSYDRAWNEMHKSGQELGHDSDEYRAARRTVLRLRQDITTAAERIYQTRRWMPRRPR